MAACLSLLAGFVAPAPVADAASPILVTTLAQGVNGDGECSLQEAIYAANLDASLAPDPSDLSVNIATGCVAGSGADTIQLPASAVFTLWDPIDDADNFVGPSVTPIVTTEILINGLGARLQRAAAAPLTRAFVVGPDGDLTLRELHVKGFAIRGGAGADGGGGGMGAGGAIYVAGGTLSIDRSTFENNRAAGGNGSYRYNFAGGGGGGLSGNGGPGSSSFNESLGGGGGGGSRGDGSVAAILGPTDYNVAGGGGGRITSAEREHPGEPCGGAGGVSLGFPPNGANDGDDAECAGGGGGGGTAREFIADPFCGGEGGRGAYGGGGGGGGTDGTGGDAGFGGGGGGYGGDSEFGGGGGSENWCIDLGSNAGQAGPFGGDGGGYAGGGGAGLGGAVFGHNATITIVNSTFTGNSVLRGRSGGDDSRDGRGAGGAIFAVDGSLTVESSTIAGNSAGEYTLVDGQPVGIGGGGLVVYEHGGGAELLLRNTIVAGNEPYECYTRNGVSTTGSQGNLVTDSRPNVRNDPPCPGVVVADDPALAPLTLNPQGRTPTMAIPSDSAAVDAAVAPVPQIDQRLVLRPQGGGFDIGAYEAASIPPVTTITVEPASPDGANGWYVSPVGVAIVATDADSAIAQTRCVLDPVVIPVSFDDLPDAACVITSVGSDGAHALYASSRDTGGNTDAALAQASFKVDRTPPTIQPTLSSPTVLVGQSGVTATANATDATSGVASQGCGAVDTSTPGSKTVTCTATDNAGNATTGDLAYVVEYRILGFFSPVPGSRWKVGQSVPAKVALADAAGTRIGDAEAVALAQACRVRFSATGAQTLAPVCAKYDAASDQFIATWKLGRQGTGPATIRMAISYPGTSIETQAALPIVIVR